MKNGGEATRRLWIRSYTAYSLMSEKKGAQKNTSSQKNTPPREEMIETAAQSKIRTTISIVSIPFLTQQIVAMPQLLFVQRSISFFFFSL